MGLFIGLLTLPLAPVRGVAWAADKLVAVAEEQFYDVDAIYAELRELEADLEEGRTRVAGLRQLREAGAPPGDSGGGAGAKLRRRVPR